MKKNNNTYPPIGPFSDYRNRYEVRFTRKRGDGKLEYIQEIWTNKKKAIVYMNKLKRFVESHKKDIVTEEEKDWGLGYFTVEKVWGLHYIAYTVEKIK